MQYVGGVKLEMAGVPLGFKLSTHVLVRTLDWKQAEGAGTGVALYAACSDKFNWVYFMHYFDIQTYIFQKLRNVHALKTAASDLVHYKPG